MRGSVFTRAICIIGTAAMMGVANAGAGGSLDEASRLIAIRATIALGCAVQDRDEVRANAWVQTLMSRAMSLAAEDPQLAKEFAAFVSGTAVEGTRRGGYECEAIPRLP